MYFPVRVSTLIFSPVLIKSGAWTVMPVSSVIDFWTLFAESPRPSGASGAAHLPQSAIAPRLDRIGTENSLPLRQETAKARRQEDL